MRLAFDVMRGEPRSPVGRGISTHPPRAAALYGPPHSTATNPGYECAAAMSGAADDTGDSRPCTALARGWRGFDDDRNRRDALGAPGEIATPKPSAVQPEAKK